MHIRKKNGKIIKYNDDALNMRIQKIHVLGGHPKLLRYPP